MICQDVLNDILSFCDSKTSISLYMASKHLMHTLKMNKNIVNRQSLIKELKKTLHKEKKHYGSYILDLKVGDRVTDRINNYKVYYIDKKMGLLEQVDMFGNRIDETMIYTKLDHVKNYKLSGVKNKNLWATYHHENGKLFINKLKYGIIKHQFGPIISHPDSIYLKYKTIPLAISDMYIYHVAIPEYHMMVSVSYKWQIHEYVIIEMKKESIKMMYVGQYDFLEKELIANKVNGTWKINKSLYTILLFGGWSK